MGAIVPTLTDAELLEQFGDLTEEELLQLASERQEGVEISDEELLENFGDMSEEELQKIATLEPNPFTGLNHLTIQLTCSVFSRTDESNSTWSP